MFKYGLVLCFCVLFGKSSPSAIPMWEYLSTQEKTSFLYSIFASQVESFCESSMLRNCNVELLKYGLSKLKHLPEDYLDAMDPYQRNANKIIWQTIMSGHPMISTSAPPSTSTTVKTKPNSYDDQSFGDLEFGAQVAASAKLDNVYIVPAPKNILDKYRTRPQISYYTNVDSYPTSYNNFGKGGAYTKLQSLYSTTTSNDELTVDDSYEGEAPLTGPMVVKVYPDGTPVRENVPLPQDEDLKQYKMSKVKLPNY